MAINGKINRSYMETRSKLQEIDAELKDTHKAFGITLMTYPGYNSSNRLVMYYNHLTAANVPNYAEIPKVDTGYSRIFGLLSSGYYKTKNNMKVVAKISRFSDKPDHLYTLFLYDESKDEYVILEKKNVENLTEKYGYLYNNDEIDKYNTGDFINKETVLTKSSGYDEYMNHGIGVNARILYTGDLRTIEDAVVPSESFSERSATTDVETVTLMINENDILGNLFGDENDYKPFPLIGESTKKGLVAFKKQIFNNQILYDLKNSNLRRINHRSDTKYHCDGIVEDIQIFSNKEIDEIPDSPFYKYIKQTLADQNRYWKQIFDTTKELLESGTKCSNEINYLFKRSSMIIDPEFKWREEFAIFNNMIIEISLKRKSPLATCSKTTGRYGNKGVASVVVPDKEMPFTKSPIGERRYVDLLINDLSVLNRVNPYQTYEQSIIRISNMIIDDFKYKNLSLQEKEKKLFHFYDELNPKQAAQLRKFYNGKRTAKAKEAFFENVVNQGIYVYTEPLWEEKSMFDKIDDLYKYYDYPLFDQVYINKWGRDIPCLGTMIVGEMYMMKLKQTAKKGFSARSLSSVGQKNVPEKSNKAKLHQEQYSHNPIRFGVQEMGNATISIAPEVIANFYRFYRSSPLARRALAKNLLQNKVVDKFDPKPEYKNINVQMLSSMLKVLGWRIEFSDDYQEIIIDDGSVEDRLLPDGTLFLGTLDEYNKEKIQMMIDDYYNRTGCFIGTDDAYNSFVDSESNRMMAELYNF